MAFKFRIINKLSFTVQQKVSLSHNKNFLANGMIVLGFGGEMCE